MDLLDKKILIVSDDKLFFTKYLLKFLKEKGASVGIVIFNNSVLSTKEKIEIEQEAAFVFCCDILNFDVLNYYVDKISKIWNSYDSILFSFDNFEEDQKYFNNTKFINIANNKFSKIFDKYFYSIVQFLRLASVYMIFGGSCLIISYYNYLESNIDSNKNFYIQEFFNQILDSTIKALAYDLGPYGIRINYIITSLLIEERNVRENQEEFKKAMHAYYENTMLKKKVSFEDVANSVLFLLSDASLKMTGEKIVLNSGLIR